MGLKHKKKRLLDIYDLGKGSGNADFANMTEEQKMQVRKDFNDNETIHINVGLNQDCTYYANYKEIVSGAYGQDASCGIS